MKQFVSLLAIALAACDSTTAARRATAEVQGSYAYSLTVQATSGPVVRPRTISAGTLLVTQWSPLQLNAHFDAPNLSSAPDSSRWNGSAFRLSVPFSYLSPYNDARGTDAVINHRLTFEKGRATCAADVTTFDGRAYAVTPAICTVER